MDEPKSLDFTVIGEPLNKLLIAVANKLEREWPQRYRNVIGARELFVMHLRTAHATYLSALYLCGDIPPDYRRKPEFCVCLPALNRALWIVCLQFCLFWKTCQPVANGSGNRAGKNCGWNWTGISRSTAIYRNGNHGWPN